MKIGTFMQNDAGLLLGRIYGLGLGTVAVIFEPQTSRDGVAYFRLVADPTNEVYEIGAAFPKTKDGQAYFSVVLDTPLFPAPVNAALFPDQDTGIFNLVWNRVEPVSVKPTAAATARVVAGKPATGYQHGRRAHA
jgi:uncharacterized protein (DUF736 family)